MKTQYMKLKRILGFTSNGRQSVISQPKTGNLIYTAGCVVVILNPRLKNQEHLFTESKQTITALAISNDGRYLATADCGLKSTVRIWDLVKVQMLAEFVAHNVEVSCMAFSSDNQILVSVGSQQDMTISVWDWRRQFRLTSQKLNTRIRAISFAASSPESLPCFVTVGEAYVKYWYIKFATQPQPTSNSNDTQKLNPLPAIESINGRNAILGEQEGNSFCDVKCGLGPMTNSTFCITKSGLLCEFDNKKRLLHKWVDLRTTSANCLTISDNLIVIGCANGVVRCFNTTELRFLKNLPRPHALGSSIPKKQSNYAAAQTISTYPNTISVGLNESSNTIACIYNDRSIYVWDLSDSDNIVTSYSAFYHSSCIWGIDMYPSNQVSDDMPLDSCSLLPQGSFITCSSDDTIRLWDPKVYSSKLVQRKHFLASNTNGSLQGKHIYQENQISDESLKIVFTDSTFKFLCDLNCADNAKRTDQNYDNSKGLRCLKISPNGTQLAVGSRSGTIRIFDFAKDSEIKNIAAHDAEVLCLEYSEPKKFDGFCYLASSSRDKLIHIFDAANDYAFLQTIDDHSSSITALRFVNNRARDCLQLISCGTDQRIIFRNGFVVPPSDHLNFVSHQLVEGKTTFYDMEVDSESSCLMTACQDRMIRLFNVAQVKYQSGFKGSISDEGTLIRLALDPTCTFLAASSTDKSISIYDYQRGECIVSVTCGLSDLVTDMKFSPDGLFLVACTGDGYIFIWSLPGEISTAIGGNLGITQLSLSSCSLGSVGKNFDEDDNSSEIIAINNSSVKQLGVEHTQSRAGAANEAKFRYLPESTQSKQQQTLNSLGRNAHYSNSRLTNLDDESLAGFNGNKRYFKSNISNKDDLQDGAVSASSASSSFDRNYRKIGSKSAVADMAKLFQSKENLDKISSREKFVTEGLVLKYDNKRAFSREGPANNPSLSGLFANSKSSSKRLVQGIRDEEKLEQRSHEVGAEKVRWNNTAQSANRARSVERRIYSASSTTLPPNVRPAKSECNLESSPFEELDDHQDNYRELHLSDTVDPQNTVHSGKILTVNNSAQDSIYCQKLDLNKLSPMAVPMTLELSQYIVDELQTISKYATRLHQRLQANGYQGLSNLVARGVQNSMDILSIVPPRPLNNPHRFQSQANLNPESVSLARRSRLQSSHAQQPATVFGQELFALKPSGSISVLGSSSSPFVDSSKSYDTNNRTNSPPVSKVIQDSSRARMDSSTRNDRQRSKSQASDPLRSGLSSVVVTGDAHERTATSSSRNLITSESGSNNLLNMDRVLEAYSDRLFKMVQGRIQVEKNARHSPATLGSNESAPSAGQSANS